MRFLHALLIAPLVARAAYAQTCPGTWSAPFNLARDGRPVYVERGVVTGLGRRTLLIGEPTFFWLRPTELIPQEWKPGAPLDTVALRWSLTRVGALVDERGVAEGVPPVDTLAIRSKPRLIGWSPGHVDVAWLAADPLTKRDGADSSNRRVDPKYTRVEHATFDGVRWSPSEVIVRGAVDEMIGAPSVRAGKRFDEGVLAITARETDRDVIRVGFRRGGGWVSATLRDSADGMSAPIAFKSADGGVTLLYRAWNADGHRMVSTRVARWIGDSAIWSPPVVAAVIGQTGGFLTPTAAHLGGDSIVVGWHQNDAGIASTLSSDGGRSWKSLPLIAGVVAEGLQFVVDERGLLHALYRGPSNPAVLGSSGAIAETRFEKGSWSVPTPVSGSSEVPMAAGSSAGGGVLVVGASILGSGLGIAPRSWGQAWSQACR